MKLSILSYKTLDSTNDKAKLLAPYRQEPFVVVAESQRNGRGRFKREWKSQKGGLYMTVVLYEPLEHVRYLTLIGALAVAKVLRKHTLKAAVKWPNDVLVDEKKICGILTEAVSGKHSFAVIGIGVNVNQKQLPTLQKQATSLFKETGNVSDLETIRDEILRGFVRLHKLYATKKFAEIRKLWKKHSDTLGKHIKVKTLNEIFHGQAIDIDKDCCLIVETLRGKRRKVVEGDIISMLA